MKKALIIEDSADIRENVAEMLILAGYEAITANNGKMGVDLALSHLPDIILCDIMMPELDGYGVLYLLQKTPQTATIPFIFMTAKAERPDVRKGMDMGADDYLVKPFDDMELFNAIESRLKKRRNPVGFRSKGGNGIALFESLKAKGKIRSFAGKQIIYVENDEPTHLYFVNKGQVKTYKRAEDGRELSSALYSMGDFFGYESLCNASNYMENAATLNETELILITKVDFMEYLFNHQEIAAAFISMFSGSIQDKQMLKLAYFSVRKRVAEVLVQVAGKFGEPGSDSCRLKISRDDLAALVGTSSETVSRMLADFKDEKLIEKEGSAIHIISLEKLRSVK